MVARAFGIGSPLLDQTIDDRVHVGDILLLPPVGAEQECLLQRQPVDLQERLGQRANHRLHERVRLIAIKRVEPVVKPAEADGVERQPGHIVGDVDYLVGIRPRPFGNELVGDVDHLRQIAPHRRAGEIGQKNRVRLRPIRLERPGSEQTIAGE